MKPGFQIFGLLLFLFGISDNVYNQSQPFDYRQLLKMPEVLPASPDAAGIEKFGNIPVSYSTGVPDISIPVWNIKCGSLSWPVSLSYHAGGIRVDETASSAGLGWSLNAPGVISRSRVGRPDEETQTEPAYSTINIAKDFNYLYSVLNGFSDSEQDIFNFNFNGKSGKFIVNQDGSILQIPLSNLKINYTTGFKSFTITDENGITYLFDQAELTSSQSMPAESTPTLYRSSWYLSKVEMPDKVNTIQFSYVYAGRSSQAFTTFMQAVGMKYVPRGDPALAPSLTNANDRSLSKVFVYTDMIRLSEIKFPNGSLTFGYDALARKDIASAYNKLSSITVNRVVKSYLSQIKNFILYQSYFTNNPTNLLVSDPTQYRLRLDSLTESGAISESSPKKYKFQYNATPMVPRENYGQDIWGYNNGVYKNPSLLQSQNITFYNGATNLIYQIGDANRNVDTNQMKACMLTSITYPTGGKTAFTFESHVYNADQTLTSPTEYETHITGAQNPQVSTTTFTYPSTAVATEPARVTVYMSTYNFPGVTQPSWVSIKDLTTGALFFVETQINPYQVISWNETMNLVQGHNYELKSYVYTSTSNSQLTASIKVGWNNYTNAPDIRKGGGLRIKEIKNYTSNGALAGTETYLYDTAVTLTPFYDIQRTYSDVFYRLGAAGQDLCSYYMSPGCRIYHSASVYAISTAAGAPLVYKRVQKITTDSISGEVNGKSEYQYDVFRDQNYPAGGPFMLIPLISNDWKNGFLISETHYKVNNGVYAPVKKTENKYTEFYVPDSYSLRVQPNYIREGCSAHLDALSISNDANWYLYPIGSGSKRLWEQIATSYDDNQHKMETKTYTYYSNSKYDFPTKTVMFNSRGKQDSVTFKRSPDLSSPGNVYEKMQQQNIIAPVVEQKSYDSSILLSTVKSNYRDWYGNGKIIELDSIQASVLNNTLETRLKYFAYDTFSNPLSVSKSKDVPVSYIWGYSGAYPIAEVINSDNNSIAYTSFETGEGGGWNGINAAGYSLNGSVTGLKSWTQNSFSFNKPGLGTGNTYTVSYWSKNGAYAVNGSAASSLRTINGWTLYEHKIVNPAGGIITVTGSGTIDELRLYPLGAQMKTYTYLPLTGVSSQCDINGNIIYYYYDNPGRLAFVQDDNRNVVKRFYYNYSGQPETPAMYGNDPQSTAYTKSCASGYIGTSFAYTAPANMYYAATSGDANMLIQADMAIDGPAYANANGTCTIPPPFAVSIQNTTTAYYTVSFNSNSVLVYPNSTASITLTSGSYTVSFVPYASLPGNLTFIINGYSSYGTSATFSGINIVPGSYGKIN